MIFHCSLPTLQVGTASAPYASRMWATQPAASAGSSAPRLAVRLGSAPALRQRAMNSSVPKRLSSSGPSGKGGLPNSIRSMNLPHVRFGTFGRLGPIPSDQWYESAKHPPGQRKSGGFKSFTASSTSRRNPRSSCGALGSRFGDQASQDLPAHMFDILTIDARIYRIENNFRLHLIRASRVNHMNPRSRQLGNGKYTRPHGTLFDFRKEFIYI